MRWRAHTRRLAAVAVGLGALGAAPAAAPAATVYGIADQHASTFTDPQFHATGMAIARLNSPWDALSTDPGRLDAWLQAARAAGVEPMIAFNRSTGSRCPSAPCVLPTVAQYAAAFDAFRARHPWVRTFTPWNEVNDPGQPTVKDPARAAAYYKVIRQRCPECTVLGADVLDNGTQLAWLKTFLEHTPEPPRLWGLHNYVDVNYFRTTGTEKTLAAVPGEVWLTETAGLVRYTDRYGVTRFPYDEQRAARATAFLLSIVDAHPGRIGRLYHYGWRQGGPSESFDTGLLRNDGTPRPALSVLWPRLPGRPAAPAVPVPAPGAGAGPAAEPGAGRVAAPGGPGAPAGAAPGPGAAPGAPAAGAIRPLTVTAGPAKRGARSLRVRVTCLAPRGKACAGTVRLARGRAASFRLHAGAQRSLRLRGRVGRRAQVAVALRAPARLRWRQAPDPGRPGRRDR